MGMCFGQAGHQGGAVTVDDQRIAVGWQRVTRAGNRRDPIVSDQHLAREARGTAAIEYTYVGE
jgi:hypothetical protein